MFVIYHDERIVTCDTEAELDAAVRVMAGYPGHVWVRGGVTQERLNELLKPRPVVAIPVTMEAGV